jgi:hypothetical protein
MEEPIKKKNLTYFDALKILIFLAVVFILIMFWVVQRDKEIFELEQTVIFRLKEYGGSIRNSQTLIGIKTNETDEEKLKTMCEHFSYGLTFCYFFTESNPGLERINNFERVFDGTKYLEEKETYSATITFSDWNKVYDFERNEKKQKPERTPTGKNISKHKKTKKTKK